MMNQSSNSTAQVVDGIPEALRNLLITLGVIIITIGIPGNILTAVAIVKCKTLRTRLNIFIVNLCIADVISVGYYYPFITFDLILGHNPVSLKWCQLNLILMYMLMPTAFVTILLITVSRYVKIIHESKFERIFSKRNTIVFCIIAWIPGLVNAVITNRSHVKYLKTVRMCLADSDEDLQSLSLSVPVFSLAYISSIICYVRVWRKLSQNEATNRNHGIDPVSLRNLASNRKQTSMSFLIVLLYICLTMPALVVISSGIYISDLFNGIVLVLYFANSSANCIVYGAMHKSIRRYYQKMLPHVWFVRVDPVLET